MTEPDPSESLSSALIKAQITSDNHQFIRRLTETVGISSYRVVDSDKPYVIAARRDGLRDLLIYWGYTAGFPSEDDTRRARGRVGDVTPSNSIKGTRYVPHPVNRVYTGSAQTKNTQREGGFCRGCGKQLPLKGGLRQLRLKL